MNTFLRAAITVMGLGIAPWAGAAEPLSKHYVAVSYYPNATEFSANSGTVSANLDNVVFRYGYQLFSMFGIEGMYGFSAAETSADEDESVQNNSMAGVYARGVVDLATVNIKLIGRVGLTAMENEYTVNTITATTTYTTEATGLSYGIGAELFGTQSTALHIEWMKFLSTDDLESEGWVLGFTHHFGMPNLW